MSTEQPATDWAPKPRPTWLKVMRLVSLVVLVGFLTILVLAATKPATFRVERSIVIKAAPAKVFPYVNNLKKMSSWSPFEKNDPELQRTYTGPEEGEEAHFAWKGNPNVGSGEMTIVKSVPDERVDLDITFIEPFEGRNYTEFTLAPEGDGTKITWAMSGPNSLPTRIMQVFIDMDGMIGSAFDQGLIELKKAVETPPGEAAAPAPAETTPAVAAPAANTSSGQP